LKWLLSGLLPEVVDVLDEAGLPIGSRVLVNEAFGGHPVDIGDGILEQCFRLLLVLRFHDLAGEGAHAGTLFTVCQASLGRLARSFFS
jgi:hypothetical protein